MHDTCNKKITAPPNLTKSLGNVSPCPTVRREGHLLGYENFVRETSQKRHPKRCQSTPSLTTRHLVKCIWSLTRKTAAREIIRLWFVRDTWPYTNVFWLTIDTEEHSARSATTPQRSSKALSTITEHLRMRRCLWWRRSWNDDTDSWLNDCCTALQ